MSVKQVLSLIVAVGAATTGAQQGAWAQCGGTSWTGTTTCINGYSCTYSNEWFSQCIPNVTTSTALQATTSSITMHDTVSRTSLAAAGAPTLFLCGDSTMANKGANDGFTNGWGPYVPPYVTIPVVNNAIGGRSARSFTREGRFASTLAAAKAGDWVIIEFGHNDGGSLTPNDNGRTPCPGTDDQTCRTVYNGANEIVLTYYAYLRNAAKAFKAKGINVVISSATPNNLWETGTWSYSTPRFSTYAKSVARDTNSIFVDHGWFVADKYRTLGKVVVNGYYPKDHTHTSPAGAKAVAEAFFRGLQCGTAGLKNALSAAGMAVPNQTCGGI